LLNIRRLANHDLLFLNAMSFDHISGFPNFAISARVLDRKNVAATQLVRAFSNIIPKYDFECASLLKSSNLQFLAAFILGSSDRASLVSSTSVTNVQ
jgi:hypothetical protein